MAEFHYQNRRDFLKYFFGSSLLISGIPAFTNELLFSKEIKKLTLLYTNDLHSRIDPFPPNDPKHPDQGGFARRAALIKQIRKSEKNVLLLDAGDIFQGTPYFNLYKGELEYKLMSAMGYDCVTLGNHDFDLGLDNLHKQMPHATFDFVNANYDFSNTILNGKIKPYKIFTKDELKIGVFGLGIELDGLVSKKLYEGTQYLNPVEECKKTVRKLRDEEKCDFVICLSHLGFKSEEKKINDQILAESTEGIDLIIGGHTHTFLNEPMQSKNSKGKLVQVTQVGWGGIWLGRYDVFFSSKKNAKSGMASVMDIRNLSKI